ncbi:MAG: SPOR domain-containing protein [Candidatus Omnitrophota bacterium]
MKISKIYFIILSLIFPAICWAADLDTLKADFLQRNYRRVIFEGQAQSNRLNIGAPDELNYILGLSYLKENKLEQARVCFSRILNGPSGKFKPQASLGLADTYLLEGKFSEAKDIYTKLIVDDSNSKQKAAVLYRLSQAEFKQGNNQQGNDYWFKLKKDFPLSPELKLSKGFEIIRKNLDISVNETDGYSVQIGFFSNRINANKLKDRLLVKGFSAYIDSSVGGYRVKIGKFKTQNEAQDLEAKLSSRGYQTKVCH